MSNTKRLTVADLEKMTTHELAELLANIVLVLRRMPDVQVQELERKIEEEYQP